MNGGKENSSLTESIDDMYEWLSNNLWIKRFLMYGIVGFITYIFMIILMNSNIFYIESQSAQYLLSTLVQSEAAIIGIVITLTFIAVQLIFSYAPQAVGVALKRNYDMWMLLIFYGISIFYGLFVLRMIPNEVKGSLSKIDVLTLWGSHVSLEYRVGIVYCLGIFTFGAIVPYLLNTVDFLKPTNIIKILSLDITESKILKYIESLEKHNEDRTKPIGEDPVKPIVDIIHSSIMRYDIATTSIGLNAITNRAVEIIDLYEEEKISNHFCDHFERVGRLTVNKMDEGSTIEIIGNLGDFGKLAVEKGLKVASLQAAQSIGVVGKAASEKGLGSAASQSAWSLETIGNAAIHKKFENVTLQVAFSLETIGKAATEMPTILQTVWSLETIGKTTTYENIAQKVGRFLGNVGVAAAKKEEFENVALEVAQSLKRLGENSADKGFENAIQRAARSLLDVGVNTTKKGLKDANHRTTESLVALSILSEKIAKIVIPTYEAGLIDHESPFFQEFMKEYEQKLEKLRTEKHI